ncbi:DNA-processing protein DprA [Neisseria sp. CSL10203-ORH2]|uniref:DNA-processing protein DprA n=1 Tax=Neisseria montereyensis TaxID=2973938 RepID=A0ABT2FEY5_9NEIS|nr:DNA-processing protein DprA [Neisseria montereyensis]MCS4534496.1 DNA-processing protein DprA [Neisseria montereyensis]
MNHSERFAWAQLALTPYIGPESFLALIQYYGSAQAALAAPAEAVSKLVRHKQAVEAWKGKNSQAITAAEAAFNWENQEQCRLMLLCDNDFPTMLTEGITPPPLLFLRGRVELLQQPAIAIVGSRHATPQALRIAHDFSKAISKHDIPVVSGMASGIDTAAHQGALSENGGTIAVWGTGIDRIYPQSNQDLAYQIAEKGLIISEFPLGTRPLAGNFPRRNRIIAALSKAVLVVEAAPESGSLITARLAGEMGREVMAVPGSIDNPHSKGCHKLIKEGAKLVECLDDILSECPSLSEPAPVKHIVRHSEPVSEQASDNTTEIKPSENPILTALGYGPIHPDNLAQTLNMPTADIYAQLLELELDNIVASLPGGRYQRIK